MSNRSLRKINYLKEKGMDVSNVNSDQLEFVYNVVINNKNPEPLSDERKYKKVKWNGDRQIEKFLNMINTNFKVCLKIKKNNSSLEVLIYSILEKNNNLFIDSNPQITLKKIKKRCDFYIATDTWKNQKTSLAFRGFIKKTNKKSLWIGNIDNDSDFKRLKTFCSIILNDHENINKLGESNGFF